MSQLPSTRVGQGENAIEVGHGINVVVLQLPAKHVAVALTASQAERLGLYLLRQATYARISLHENDGSGT